MEDDWPVECSKLYVNVHQNAFAMAIKVKQLSYEQIMHNNGNILEYWGEHLGSSSANTITDLTLKTKK